MLTQYFLQRLWACVCVVFPFQWLVGVVSGFYFYSWLLTILKTLSSWSIFQSATIYVNLLSSGWQRVFVITVFFIRIFADTLPLGNKYTLFLASSCGAMFAFWYLWLASALINIHNPVTITPVIMLGFLELGLSWGLVVLPLLPHGLAIKYWYKAEEFKSFKSSLTSVLIYYPVDGKLWYFFKKVVSWVSFVIIVAYLVSLGINSYNLAAPSATSGISLPTSAENSNGVSVKDPSGSVDQPMASDQYYFNLINTTCVVITTTIALIKFFSGR